MNVIGHWFVEMLGRFTRTLDGPLLVALLLLMGIGLAVLYSAGGQVPTLVLSQGIRYLLGLGALWLLSRVRLQSLKRTSPVIYVLSLLPLIAVLFIGTGRSGAHWINLGVFYFQPSELMKLSLPLMLAWCLDQGALPPNFARIFAALALIALPTGLILLQPDFGSAVLVASSGLLALYLAGLSWWWFIAAGGGAVIAASIALFAPIQWLWMLKPYQQDRILTFRDPSNDPLGAGWNIIQSKIAIGSGGISGQGWGKGTQAYLNYVPEHSTDFIFAVLGEEFGWLGVVFVFMLYLFIIGRCLWIAVQANDGFARLLAGTLGLALFIYVLVNGGMVAGVLPVIGVPMPLLSYGGTAAVSLLAGMGVVMAVQAGNGPGRRRNVTA